MNHPKLELSEEQLLKLKNKIAAQYKGPMNSLHVKFTHDETVFRYPPESFIKKLKRLLGIKPKGSPFIKLEE